MGDVTPVSHVVVPWSLLLCGFSYDQPRSGVWVSRGGVKAIAYGKHGVPFGRARVIWLHLATQAAEFGQTIQISLSEIAAQCGGKVRTIKAHLRRLAECYYELPDAAEPADAGPVDADPADSRKRLFEIIDAQRATVTISLYAEFMRGVQDAIRCPRDTVQKFVQMDRLAALDLYLWYQWHLHRASLAAVDAFGAGGPFAILPIADDIDKRRDELRKRHATVIDLWPECPFGLDGDNIVHAGDRAKARPPAKARVKAPAAHPVAVPARKFEALEKLASKTRKPKKKTARKPVKQRATPARARPARSPARKAPSSTAYRPRQPQPYRRPGYAKYQTVPVRSAWDRPRPIDRDTIAQINAEIALRVKRQQEAARRQMESAKQSRTPASKDPKRGPDSAD